MKHYLLALLLGTVSLLGSSSEPILLLDVDFAVADESERGALVVPNSEVNLASSGESVALVAKTDGGSVYTLDDVVSEEDVTFLQLQPEKKSFLEVTLPESIAPANDDFSVTFWFRPSSSQSIPGYLLSAGTVEPTWFVQFSENSVLHISFNGHVRGSGGSTLTHKSSAPLSPGEWNHVTIVFDRNESILVYLNGVLDSISVPIASHTEAMPARIFLGGFHQYPSGSLGQFRLYRGKLAEEQVQKLVDEVYLH